MIFRIDWLGWWSVHKLGLVSGWWIICIPSFMKWYAKHAMTAFQGDMISWGMQHALNRIHSVKLERIVQYSNCILYIYIILYILFILYNIYIYILYYIYIIYILYIFYILYILYIIYILYILYIYKYYILYIYYIYFINTRLIWFHRSLI
jgi:hypothetical protein